MMKRIQFANFEIDLELFTLSQNGQQIRIGAKPLDLLICLIENRGRVVDREFLRQDVWDSAELSPATIPTCILELRRTLSDNASDPTFIQSLRGRGYRFIGAVRPLGGRHHSGPRTSDDLAFVGRDEELETLRASVRSINNIKKGRVILVTGEAGIGKTRLLEEFTDSVRGKTSSFLAKSPAIAGAPAFLPWTQLLNEALETCSASNIELVANASRLATVFPEIKVAKCLPLDKQGPSDRFTIFSQWTRTIRSIAEQSPIILGFEDVHRADRDSLALLYWISEELSDDPILLVATHRPYPGDSEVADTLSEICTMPQTTQLTLGPLSQHEISLLLDPLHGDRDAIGRSLKGRTGGNAFYVTHLIRCLNKLPDLDTAESLASSLPLNGREILVRQLSDLPTDTKDTLAAASVLGDQFQLEALSRILNSTPSRVIESLEPATRAWLIREDGSEYRFNHSLLRDALYQNTEASRRRELHLRAARDLIELDANSMSAQIADHIFNAIPIARGRDASRYAQIAGREAASRFAHVQSRAFFERALDILRTDRDARLSDQYSIMIDLAKATLYCGDRDRSRELLIQAANMARMENSPEKIAECALSLAPDFLTIEVGSYDSVLIGLIQEALESLGPNSISLRAQLQARLSQARQWEGLSHQNEKMALAALDTARISGDSNALLAALAARAESLHGPQQASNRLCHIVELGEVAQRTGNIHALLLQRTRLMTAYLELGEIRNIEIENERYRSEASKIGLPQYHWYPGATDCMLAMLRGDFSSADELAAEYRKAAGANPDQNFKQTFAAQHVLRALERDKSLSVLPLVENFAAQHKSVLSWSAAIPWFRWESGLEPEAREALDTFTEQDIRSMAREPGGGAGLALLAEVAAALDSEMHVKVLFELILPITDRCASAGYGVVYLGSFARYAGLLADSLGDTSRAVHLLSLAVEQEARRGAPTWHAYAQVDLDEIVTNSREYGGSGHGQITLLGGTNLESLPRLKRRLAASRFSEHSACGS